MFDVIFVTHQNMMTIPIPTVTKPPDTLPYPTCCVYFAVPVLLNMMMTYQQFPRIRYVTRAVYVSVIQVRWSMICCQTWGCTRLLVGKLGHTGLVSFVNELGTGCGEVPLEYGFEVLV